MGECTIQRLQLRINARRAIYATWSSCIQMVHAFKSGGSIYWGAALIGAAFIATTITTLIADPTNVYYGPIIAESNN